MQLEQGVPVTRDGLTTDLQREKHQEILIDSYISQSRRVEMERELERWVPDDTDPVCPELENIFDVHWDRWAHHLNLLILGMFLVVCIKTSCFYLKSLSSI